MAQLHYEVTATHPDQETRERFVRWLLDTHLHDVVDAGALSAEAIRLDGDGYRVLSRYVFESREAFAEYEAGPAIALRGEGVELFGTAGVVFERRVGEILS
ncbi:MAG: DUF4286 family protein [Planctomycetota bacterium]|jgi:hypothetical protein